MDLDYSADHIQVLQGLEHVRKRPGMYIGTTGPEGLHHLVYEVVDNSIDEALAGFCNEVNVILEPGNVVRVEDNGRGIPVDIHPTEGVSALEVVMTKLNAGGKFDKKSYKVSGGLHGVGVSVVNALSEWCEVSVHLQGQVHFQRYERGTPVEPVKAIAATARRGTVTRFKPDHEVFPDIDFSFDVLSQRLRELAFLNSGVKVSITDERIPKPKSHLFEFGGGLKSFIEYLNKNKKSIQREPIYVSGTREDVAGRDLPRVQRRLRRDDLQLRQQHQHPRGRHAPHRLPRGSHPHAQRLPEEVAPRQEVHGVALRRRRARGPDRGHIGQGPRAAVRRPDQGPSGQQRGPGAHRVDPQRGAHGLLRGEPRGDRQDPREDRGRRQGAGGRAQGPRDDPAQERARGQRPSRQARGLLGARPRALRDLHRRRRLRGRQRQGRPRLELPGDPAALGQDDERREDAHRTGAGKRQAAADHHGSRHGRGRRL